MTSLTAVKPSTHSPKVGAENPQRFHAAVSHNPDIVCEVHSSATSKQVTEKNHQNCKTKVTGKWNYWRRNLTNRGSSYPYWVTLKAWIMTLTCHLDLQSTWYQAKRIYLQYFSSYCADTYTHKKTHAHLPNKLYIWQSSQIWHHLHRFSVTHPGTNHLHLHSSYPYWVTLKAWTMTLTCHLDLQSTWYQAKRIYLQYFSSYCADTYTHK